MNRKLSARGLVSVVGMAVLALSSLTTTGCGPGLSHRAYGAEDVLAQMDAELAHSIPGGVTLSSGALELPELPLPETRMPVSDAANPPNGKSEGEAPAAPQTWGSQVPQYDGVRSIYEP